MKPFPFLTLECAARQAMTVAGKRYPMPAITAEGTGS